MSIPGFVRHHKQHLMNVDQHAAPTTTILQSCADFQCCCLLFFQFCLDFTWTPVLSERFTTKRSVLTNKHIVYKSSGIQVPFNKYKESLYIGIWKLTMSSRHCFSIEISKPSFITTRLIRYTRFLYILSLFIIICL